MIIFRRLSSVTVDLPKIMEIDTPWQAVEDQSNEYQLHFGWRGTGVISFGLIGQQYWIVSYRWQILWVGGTSGPTRQFSGVGSVLQLWIRRACTLLLMFQGFLAPKWGTYHFWEIHICEAAPLSINAILPICEGLVAARTSLSLSWFAWHDNLFLWCKVALVTFVCFFKHLLNLSAQNDAKSHWLQMYAF